MKQRSYTNLTKKEIKNYGTRTLFEWYIAEMRQRTRMESKGDAWLRLLEKEIEERLRECELNPKK